MINLNLLLPKHVDDDLRNPQRCQIKTLGGADIKKAPFFDNYAHYDLKTFKELLVTEGNKARENGGKELKSGK